MILFKNRYRFTGFLVITAIVFSVLFLGPNYRHYPSSGIKDLFLIVGHWGVSALGLFVLTAIMAVSRYVYFILFPLFTILGSVSAFFVWQIDISINPALVESLIQTNVGEIANYISWPLIVFLLLCLGLSFFSVFLRFRISWNRKEAVPLIILVVVCAALFLTVNRIRYNTLTARAPFSYFHAVNGYFSNIEEIQSDRVMLGKGASCKNDSLITVFVIGEALRADHLQMNGYHRETMPKMEARGVVSLPNVYSPHTHTAASLRYILTRAEESNPDPMFRESSFVDIFSESSFHSAWLGNQNPVTPVRFFINECDTVAINKPQFSDYSNTKKFDSDLVEPYKSLIRKNRKKQLIVLHMAGNHWWYNNNLPEDHVFYTPILENKTLSLSNKERMINSYDNVTRFVDTVIDSFIASLEGKNALLIFLSDHGQSFGEKGKWLHTNDMPAEKNPASFVWMSGKYKKLNAEKAGNIQKNRKKRVDTSFLFHTILDGSNIITPHLNASLSLFSAPTSLQETERIGSSEE
ncbi:MAG: sulfatase-like hydrolase/transferase [Marinilabilia sp.]